MKETHDKVGERKQMLGKANKGCGVVEKQSPNRPDEAPCHPNSISLWLGGFCSLKQFDPITVSPYAVFLSDMSTHEPINGDDFIVSSSLSEGAEERENSGVQSHMEGFCLKALGL